MKYYLLGIKGSGMSSLASILFDLGYEVVGYDDSLEYKYTLVGLEKRGIKIYHDNSFIPDINTIVCHTNAISEEHQEIKRMQKLNLKTIRYQDLLGGLSREFDTISVSGAHGKTTTSLMIASILERAYGANYFVGDGTGHASRDNKLFVLESCEYNKHFLSYYPKNLIITNIELEHTESYKDLDDIIAHFNILVNQTKDNIIMCGDDLNILKIKTDKEKIYYGFNDDNNLMAVNVMLTSVGSSFDCYYNGELFDSYDLKVFGSHMILDALASIAIGIIYKVPKNIIREELNNFKGAKRRFNEIIINGTIIIDDYAHHPTELKVTLNSAKQKYPDKEVVAVFLPNTYSRTEALFDDFIKVFNEFDKAYIMDIKCDREDAKDYPGVNSDNLIKEVSNGEKISIETIDKLLDYKDQVICFMSCANISDMIEASRNLFE